MCGKRLLSPPSAGRVVASLLLAALLSSACTRAADDARTSRGAPDTAAVPSVSAANAGTIAASSPPSLADSVAAADARFQAARAAVNRDAAALDARSGERHSAVYASAFDELRRRMLAAESLRADRDALRARLRRRSVSSATSLP